MTELYTEGTIAVESGSVDFEVTGGVLLPTNIKRADVINVAGHVILVDQVTDITHGKFAIPYPGETGSGLPYAAAKTSPEWGTTRGLAPNTAELIQLLSTIVVEKTGIAIDAYGTTANRSTHNAAAGGFVYLAVDGAWTLYIKLSATAGDWSAGQTIEGVKGDPGLIGDLKGPWVTGTAYAELDAVTHGGSSYMCLVAHTSNVFATDLVAGKWLVAAEKGDQGAPGNDGADGEDGVGVPAGGAPGQILKKASSTDYDTIWGAPAGGGGDVTKAADRAALKALDTASITLAYLTEAGRAGTFVFMSGNYSASVAADTREGIYVKATAVAASAGCWVRVFASAVQVEWFGAVGDGATNDGPAINSAIQVAGIGGVVEFAPKVYATQETIVASIDGLTLVGRQAGATFSVSPTTTEGTVLKWTGASGGTLAYFGCLAGGSADMSGGGIRGVQFDGNILADKVLHLRSCSFSTFSQLKITGARNNSAAVCLYVDSDVQARAGINSMYRCNFDNIAIHVMSASAHGLWITGAPDETSGRHPAFCTWHGIHVTHVNGDAVRITSADDLLFSGISVSKAAGGTGRSVHLLPGANRAVVGLTFIQVHLGSNDTPEFRADSSAAGSSVHGIAVYGLQGVDAAPTVSLVGGATIERLDYLGTSYDPSAAVRAAVAWSPPIKLGNYANPDDDVLDYYKERTPSLLLTFGGAAVGLTASASFGRSTRVGRMVMFKAQVTLTAKGTSTGAAIISGLPYAATDGWALSVYATGLAAGVAGVHLSALTNAGSIALYKQNAGNVAPLTDADFTNATSLVISGCYQTSDAAA